MSENIRNVFISHIHQDDEGLKGLKRLAEKRGMVCRDSSITIGKFNKATNEDYIKYQILAPHIRWASVLVVYISPDTKCSRWVNWEIEYAYKQGKRIIGVWEWGARDCDVPEALYRYGDTVVGWNGESIVDAINGKSTEWRNKVDSKQNDSIITAIIGIGLCVIAYKFIQHRKQSAYERFGYSEPVVGYRRPRSPRFYRR